MNYANYCDASNQNYLAAGVIVGLIIVIIVYLLLKMWPE